MSNKNIISIAAMVIALVLVWKFVAIAFKWALIAGVVYAVYVLFFAGRSTGSTGGKQ